MTYAEGSSFEGVFNGERIKEGVGKYTWMKPAEEDGEDPQVCFSSAVAGRAVLTAFYWLAMRVFWLIQCC